MQLPKGITSFTRKKPEYEKTLIADIAEELKANGNCKILGIQETNNSRNYHTIEIEYYPVSAKSPQKVSILIHGIFKLWAMIDSEQSGWMDLKFLSPPDNIKTVLAKNIKEVPITVLNSKIKLSDLSQLDKMEIKMINYWNTQNVGGIIFNGYD